MLSFRTLCGFGFKKRNLGLMLLPGSIFTLQNTVSEPPPITFGTPGPGQEMFVPKTTLLDAFGDRDVTDERHAEVKKIAQGLAPKGTIARVTVREQVPLATPRGQNPDSV